MAGRPRKPTALKVVGGTHRADRGSPNEPAPAPIAPGNLPEMPSGLSARGKRAWREAAEIATRMGVLTSADPVALEELAETLADLRAARASLGRPLMLPVSLKDDGTLEEPQFAAQAGERYYWTRGMSGWMRRTRPEVADIADASRRLALWVSRFGMTPADRSRVSAIKGKEANPFADLG